MKKYLVLVLALVMICTVVLGCGQQETPVESEAPAESEAPGETEAPEASNGESYKIFLITMDQQDQHWVNVDLGAKKAAEELNVEYSWIAPDVKDDAKQIEMVNQAVADGADAIVIAANGPDAVTAALEDAEAAGVKIVYVDSPANYPAVQTIATDNKAAGTTAGEELKAALEANGVTSGQIGIVGVSAATQSTNDREAGFQSAFEGTDFELLEVVFTNGDPTASKDAATNFITQGVVGLFGSNEGTTVGVGNAIKEAGGEIIGVGFDKSDMILNLVEDGSLLAVMAQNPNDMGYKGIQAAVKALNGEEVTPDYIDSGVSVIKADNVGDFR